MNDDAMLRNDSLVFYRDVIERIDKVLEMFLARSNSKTAILIDKDGHLITMHGQERNCDMDTVCTLLAGTFAATREWAKLLGEDEFSVLFHQGKHESIQVTLVEDRTLLAVIFGQDTQLGLVRHFCGEAVKKLALVFEEAANRDEPPPQELDIRDGMKGAREALEEIFKDM